ncbi:MAG: zinc ribbon domain-containing protein [Kofleriaceae bacterium]|nr:zinc ribbon domain-containing protein [Kofleriaceae bacterium]
MPTYEYRCNACHRDFEYQQRMSDDDLVKCEVCGEDKLEKLISRTAFQLKGGGWYKDLYSSPPSADKGGTAKKDAVVSSADSSSSSSSSESGSSGSSGSSASSGSSSSSASSGSTSSAAASST